MSISQRFLTSDGLIPSTIFDKGDADMDVSEEMEEIRELLYELITKKFPRGVASDHLANVYRDEYVSKSLGPELPPKWLDQVKAAEEFETQSRGPLTILFVRLKNASIKPMLPSKDSRVNSPLVIMGNNGGPSPLNSPLQFAHMLGETAMDRLSFDSPHAVTAIAYTNADNFHIRLDESQSAFAELKKALKDEYEGNTLHTVTAHDLVVKGAYAVRDSQGDWFRVILSRGPSSSNTVECFFVDVGVSGVFPLANLRLLTLRSVKDWRALCTRVFVGGLKGDLPKDSLFLDDSLRDILFHHDPAGAALTPRPLKLTWLDSSAGATGARGVGLQTEDGEDVAALLTKTLHDAPRIMEGDEVKQTRPSSVVPHIPSSSWSDFSRSFEMSPMEAKGMPRRPFLAHPIYASGPAEISLRQASLDPMPDYMYDKLAEESNETKAVLSDKPQTGEHYACFVDGIWQRVQCIRGSKIDPHTFLVYLVDVGAFHYAKPGTLRRLNALSPFKKMFTFKCKIFGVAPMGGGEVWSREAQMFVNHFFEETHEEPVEVIPRGEWSNWKQLNAPCLPVVEASIRWGNGRDLGDCLISSGLAVPSI